MPTQPDACQPGLSVVVPVFNSEQSLVPLVDQLEEQLGQLGRPYEIILVNDGSRDASWPRVQELAAARPAVTGVNLMRNYGQHNALLCGVRLARHDVIVTLDDDLQHPPAEVPKLLARLEEGYDVVYGTPHERPHGLFRNLASAITKLALQAAMGAETARHVSAFRAFRTPLRQAFANFQGPFVSLDVLLTWGTTRFSHVRVRHEPRTLGRSNYTFRKLVTHALNMITGFSTLPLQAASVLGFFLTLFGLAILVYVVVRFFLDSGAPAGFPFLASIIAIFSGTQLFVLGMIGEYLARVHFRLMDRPAYCVREQCGPRT